MKKPFQILNIAIAIVLVSCGKHNAEISGMVKNEGKELSTNNSIAANEPDLLLIDIEGQLRFNGEPGQGAMLRSRPLAGNMSYNIDKREEAKPLVD
ncbi:MAG TPA: hypothetical protein VF144_08620 [Chitinophagaceae bacterium]